MKTVADALGIARSHLAEQAAAKPRQHRGRPPQPDAALLAEIEAIIAGQPSYGYRRVHALIRRQRERGGGSLVNVKRVYRVIRHSLILVRHTGTGMTP
jgi:putative transposase